jgi:choline dehydrogenase-like flavoprotein
LLRIGKRLEGPLTGDVHVKILSARHGAPKEVARVETVEFDVVLVGGGTSGPVVASRLSADPDVRVCLIEAGPLDLGGSPGTPYFLPEADPYLKRLAIDVGPAPVSPLAADFFAACRTALGVPVVDDFNAGPFIDGAGPLPVGAPAPAAYLESCLDRPNLTVLTETFAAHLDPGDGVTVRWDGEDVLVRARHEYVLCAGAIGTPRLLLRSGIGPADHLAEDGIAVRADLPGVGEYLADHPAALIRWSASRPVPETSAGLFVQRDPAGDRPDLMFQLGQEPFAMTVSVPRPRSTGRVRLFGPDFGCWTDPERYDERTVVDGLRLAREVAATEPFASWIGRELTPGPEVRTDEELSAYVRAAPHTARHPAGTCRPGAVVDEDLLLTGFGNVRIADASVLREPANPAVDVLLTAERAADLIGQSLYREGGRQR